MNPCALCLETKPLRRSHVVPEFMHAGMYDEKHRIFGLSSVSSKPVRLFQKGLREPLLCEDCEQQVGRYEAYASRVLNGGNVRIDRVEIGFEVSGLDYARLKLFFLSLLWRFSVTTIEQYRGAQLGPHTERLRQLLVREDPGDHLTYPCLITAVMMDGKHVRDLIVPPASARVERQHVWSFVVGGFLLSFFVGKGSPPPPLQPAFLQEVGTLLIQVKEMRDIEFLYKFALEMGAAHRERKARSSGKALTSPAEKNVAN